MKGGKRVNNCVKAEASTDRQFTVEGEMTFLNPFGTGRKTFPVGKYIGGKATTTVSAATKEEAATVAAVRIAKERRFTRQPAYIPNVGYRVTSPEPGQMELGLAEAGRSSEYKLSSSFMDLPDSPPHGFWVTKDGKFIVVNRMFGHDEAVHALFPDIIKGKVGVAALQSAMKHGMMRVAKMGSDYGLTYHPMYTGSTVKKTAKDIAEFYNMGVVDDFEGL